MSDRTSRSYDFNVARTETTEDGLTLEGYAAVFNQSTAIRDWEGEYEETIAPGAFKRTINSDRLPILQFDHGTHPMIGSIPLGAVRHLAEDEHGLFVRARLSDNWLVQPVREAILDGGITGMSFQFSVTRDEWSRDRAQRTVKEVKLYELGPVVWPAYQQTTVGVRSDITRLLSDETFRSELLRGIYTAEACSPDPAVRTSDEIDDTPPPALVVPDRSVADRYSRIAARVASPIH